MDVSELRVHLPDDVAERLAIAAAQRGTSAEDIAAEVLALHAPASPIRSLPFVAMFEAPPGFDVCSAEEQFEAEGFVASS